MEPLAWVLQPKASGLALTALALMVLARCIEWCAMNPDQTIIQSAYEDAIKELYAKLFQGYAEAGGDAAQQKRADQHFMAGVGLARSSRDRAVDLLA
jgi:hypothetical protein